MAAPGRASGCVDSTEHLDSSADAPNGLRNQLRQRQLARNRKSCLPCRERKVRCSRQTPCLTCVQRGHADLCRYQDGLQAPQEHGRIGAHADARQSHPHRTGNVATPSLVRADRHDAADQGRRRAASPDAENEKPNLLGGGSMIAMARQDHAQPSDRQNLFEAGILHLLGMSDNSDQATTETQGDNPYTSLPDEEEMIKLFEFYRQRDHPFHCITFDLDEIEKRMCSLLVTRFRPDIKERQGMLEVHQLLSLLHAIWASGAQFSDLPWDRRTSLSQEHVTQAFAHLRRSDYFSKPSKATLQALLLLGNVLQNDMKPQAAWILGGTTTRLALSMGIHKPQPQYGATRSWSQGAGYLRLATVWQDVLHSLAFDRLPTSHEMDNEHDLPELVSPGSLGYRQAMNWLCHLALRHLSRRATTAPLDGIKGLFQDMESLENSLAPHLRDVLQCTAVQEVREHYNFELHKNFSLSTISRPIASARLRQSLGEAEAAVVFRKYLDALKCSAWAFLRLCSICNRATRSWASVHNGLTSALMLSFLKETRYENETRLIQTGLIERLMGGDDDMSSATASRSVGRLSDVHKKALRALHTLKRLAEADSVPARRDDGHTGALQTNILREQVAPSDERIYQPAPSSPETPGAPHIGAQGDFVNGDWDMDEWLRTFNGDSNSPLEAFDFIMTGQQQDFTF